MIKVLFISYYLPPLLYPQSIQVGRILYYLKMYKELKITVITADEIGSIKDENLYPDIFDDLEVYRIKSSFNPYLNLIKIKLLPFIYLRPDIYMKWMKEAYKLITANFKYFDVILTFSYPLSTNILGRKLKEFYNCKWIAHNSDPWVDNPHLRIPFFLRKYHRNLEKSTFLYADKLIFTSLETAQFYKSKYPSAKIDFINHSFDENLYTYKIKRNKQDKKFVFRYIGSFYGKRTPEPLLKALKLMTKDELEKFSIELIGGGKKAELLVKSYNLPNVKTLPIVSYKQSLELMEKSDCLLVIDAYDDNESMFFPSKLADYIGAKRPILGISPKGTTSRILKELGYKCYEPKDILGIKRGLLEQLKSKYISEKVENYNIKYNIKKFIEVIKNE